jgi:transcriptional regulator with XRE-family HTH domain
VTEQNNDHLVTIGKNIHRLRKKKGLTLNEFAAQVDLSASYLSQIENARVNVNLSTLAEIGNQLGVPLITLFAEEEKAMVGIVKRDNRQWFPLSGQAVESILLKYMSNMEICIIRLPPGENSGISDQHPGDEVCFVIKGSIRTILNEDTAYELLEHDMIYYESSIPHRWENLSEDTSEFIVINTPATY